MAVHTPPPSDRKCEMLSKGDKECKCWATHVVEMADGKIMRICGVHRYALRNRGIPFQVIEWMGTESR